MDVRGISPADVAAALGLSEGEAWHFAHNIERFYKPARLQQIGRKSRLIDAMTDRAKALLRKLHRLCQRERLYHGAAHGGVRRRSCFTSAVLHLGSRGLWTRDAKDCFPSVSPSEFCKELRAMGFRHDAAKLLTLLCTVRGRIPQGSPSSNDALNLFLWRADENIACVAAHNGCRYGRVADDFVVSDRRGLRGDEAVQVVEDELKSRGIKVNKKKRRKAGFQPNSSVQVVHSITVNRRNGTAICDEHADRARQLADTFVAAARSVQASTFEAVACKRRTLVGMMHYSRQAKFGPAKYLFRQLRAGDRRVARKLAKMNITADKGRWWLVHKKRNEPKRIAAVWRIRLGATTPPRTGKNHG